MSLPTKFQPNRWIIAECIYKHGPMSFTALANYVRDTNQSRTSVATTVRCMLEAGQLIGDDSALDTSDEMDVAIAERAEAKAKEPLPQIAQPKTAPIFRPLSAKNIPSSKGTRDDTPPRDMHFVSAGDSQIPFRNY